MVPEPFDVGCLKFLDRALRLSDVLLDAIDPLLAVFGTSCHEDELLVTARDRDYELRWCR